jgi:putative resolvase
MDTYNVRAFARRIGVSVKTLQRWDREGKLVPLRTPGNRRLYTQDHVNQILSERVPDRKVVVYLRVSSQAQKPDLDNQQRAIEQFCQRHGIAIDEWIREIGGGLNFKRPKLLDLIARILTGDIQMVVIAHKDRLARFGFDLIDHLATTHGCTIRILNQETLSPEQEMVQDLMTIMHCFSSRLYGLRNYRTALKKALDHDTRPQDPTEPNA